MIECVPPTEASESFHQDDACQPGADAGLSTEFTQVREGAPISGLYDIFSLVVVPHDTAGDAIKAPIAKARDGPHRRHIILCGARDKVCFGFGMGHGCTCAPQDWPYSRRLKPVKRERFSVGNLWPIPPSNLPTVLFAGWA
jgi:hypothetical protein